MFKFINERIKVHKFLGGFLLLPIVIAIILGTIGSGLAYLETNFSWVNNLLPHNLLATNIDGFAAINIFSNIATAMMTVVSIVFAVLLMTLTLTSTQFSPRIIVAFVQDKITQQTLGIYLGTFLYCLGVLPFINTSAKHYSPIISVYGAFILAIACVIWLLYFINHISKAVSVNHIIHKIARQTEVMINDVMPDKNNKIKHTEYQPSVNSQNETQIVSNKSGYIRSINADQLVKLAKSNGIRINVIRRVGHFVPFGVPLMSINEVPISSKLNEALCAAFSIGPTRRLGNDIEFGILQIVDIALRALSSAINDPSTAITCIDQLSSIIINLNAREIPKTMYFESSGKLLVSIPWLGFERLLDSAFEQIRICSRNDIAVSLRILRAFNDIAITTDNNDYRKLLLKNSRKLLFDFKEQGEGQVLVEMNNRIASLESMIGHENHVNENTVISTL